MQGLPTPPTGYLDAIGGQPMLPAALAARQVADGWADPTALHHPGRRAGALLDAARASLAASLTRLQVPDAAVIRPEDIAFTAGSPTLPPTQGPLRIAAVEARELLDAAEARGAEVVGVDAVGRVDPSGFRTAGVVRILQAANPEVGTCQPVDEIGPGSLVMDTRQVIARSPLPGNWTTLLADARDFGGPAGVGLRIQRGGAPRSVRGWIGGRPDVAGAVAAATALETLTEWGDLATTDRVRTDAIRAALAAIPDCAVLGDPVDRLPHIVCAAVLYVSGEALVHALAARGFAVASGSACVSEEERPSHVLAAMGAYTGGTLRISLPFGCTDQTVEQFIAAVPAVVSELRDETIHT